MSNPGVSSVRPHPRDRPAIVEEVRGFRLWRDEKVIIPGIRYDVAKEGTVC